MTASLYEARKNRRRHHRVGAALVAPAFSLVWLHFACEVALIVHANGGGDGITEHRLHQRFEAVVAFYFKELGELCFATCIVVHVLLLTTGARAFGRRSARGRLRLLYNGDVRVSASTRYRHRI